MAYDKVVDSAQLDAALTATANAIREKAGNTDACTWDASTGFASLIAAIQEGGGGGDIKIVTGTFSPAEEVQAYTIGTTSAQVQELFGGTMPNSVFAGYWVEEEVSEATPTHSMSRAWPSAWSGTPHYYNGSSHTRGSLGQGGGNFTTSVGLRFLAYSNCKFKVGKTYRWFLLGS